MMKDLLRRSISALIILPFSIFFILKGGYFFISFLIICLTLSIIEWNNMIKNKTLNILGNLFIFFSFFSTYQIRFFKENDQNLMFFLMILLVCISTDIGGYIFGKIFKGPKLTKISPNKTYAGVVGGFLSSLILIYLISIYFEFFYKFDLKLISYILFISLISQIGDLIVSYFKRLSNTKDTGKLIPGHGGILDRIDGMIFVFPIIFIFEQLF
jgi:phosphatidate cytidylyltransferase